MPPQWLTLFVRFVRLNPSVAADDAVMDRVFHAYRDHLIDDDDLPEPDRLHWL